MEAETDILQWSFSHVLHASRRLTLKDPHAKAFIHCHSFISSYAHLYNFVSSLHCCDLKYCIGWHTFLAHILFFETSLVGHFSDIRNKH